MPIDFIYMKRLKEAAMITRTRFVTVFRTDRDKRVEFSKTRWLEGHDDQLSTAIRLVQKELGGIVVS